MSGAVFAVTFLGVIIGGNLLVLWALWFTGKLPDSRDRRKKTP